MRDLIPIRELLFPVHGWYVRIVDHCLVLNFRGSLCALEIFVEVGSGRHRIGSSQLLTFLIFIPPPTLSALFFFFVVLRTGGPVLLAPFFVLLPTYLLNLLICH